MSATSDLKRLPIFEGFTDAQLDAFVAQFDVVDAEEGWVLFEAGSEALHLDLLLSGAVTLYELGEPRLALKPPAIIGELGVATGIDRNTTARTTERSQVLRIARHKLLAFLEERGDISFRYHLNLLTVVSDKVKRDEQRLAEMRANIIETQRMMKQMRDLVLGSPETTLSEPLYAMLEHQISHNRRVNYVIEPPRPLPAVVRLADGRTVPVLAMSRTMLKLPPGSAAIGDENWKGVLHLGDSEIPVDGTAHAVDSEGVDIEIGLLIDEYAAVLETYLMRAQILDFVV